MVGVPSNLKSAVQATYQEDLARARRRTTGSAVTNRQKRELRIGKKKYAELQERYREFLRTGETPKGRIIRARQILRDPGKKKPAPEGSLTARAEKESKQKKQEQAEKIAEKESSKRTEAQVRAETPRFFGKSAQQERKGISLVSGAVTEVSPGFAQKLRLSLAEEQAARQEQPTQLRNKQVQEQLNKQFETKGMISEVKREPGIQGLLKAESKNLDRLIQGTSEENIGGLLNVPRRIAKTGLNLVSFAIGAAQTKSTPDNPFAKQKYLAAPFITLGKNLFSTGGFTQVGPAIRQNPSILVEEGVYQFAGAGLLDEAIKLSRAGTARINPRYTPAVNNILKIKSLQPGRDFLEIKLVGGVKSTAKPLSEQAKIAGTTVDAVSAQRGLFDDAGKVILGKPASDPLETSFFADPDASLRTSRLELREPKTSFVEQTVDRMFADEIGLPGQDAKRQAVIIENLEIEKLPKDIKKSLTSGKTLSASQQKRLLDLQLTPSGKGKPIGFLSKESEITIPAGEFLEEVGKRETTVLKTSTGKPRRVDIIKAQISKGKDAPKKIQELLSKEKKGLLTSKEAGELIGFKQRKAPNISKPTVRKPGRTISDELISARPRTLQLSSLSRLPRLKQQTYGLSGMPKTKPYSIPRIQYTSIPTYPKTPRITYASIPTRPTGGSTTYTPATYPTRTITNYYGVPTRTPQYTQGRITRTKKIRLRTKPNEEKTKTNKQLKLELKYKPSIKANLFEIKGKTPKLLTGLEVRPI